LTVASGDGKSHQVVLRTPSLHVVNVPPGGRGSTSIPGLRAGKYGIFVDGTLRGALLIGGEPGP
jgi:hypothetical protein